MYIVVDAADSGAVALTTSDGYSYGIVNGVLRASNTTNTLFQVANLSIRNVYTVWEDGSNGGTDDEIVEACELSSPASNEDLQRITATSITMRVTAGTRTRVANYAADKTITNQAHFASLSWQFESYVTVTINIDNTKSGLANVFSFATNNDKVFYSVSGEDSNKTKAQVDALIEAGSGWKVDASLPTGGLTVGPNA